MDRLGEYWGKFRADRAVIGGNNMPHAARPPLSLRDISPALRGNLPPTHARPARKQAKPARKSRQSTFLFAPRSRVIFLSPQAIKKHPYKRGSVSTLRLDNLRAWAEMGPGACPRRGVQGRFPHCVGEMSRSDKRGRSACGVARRGVQGRFPHCVGEMSRSDKGGRPACGRSPCRGPGAEEAPGHGRRRAWWRGVRSRPVQVSR